MEELLQWLCAIYPLSPECLAHLRHIVRCRTIKKGQLLLDAGEVCENIYFIKKGLLRCYYIKKKKEVTDWFFWETDTVVAVKSYYEQKPSDEYIDSLEDSEMFYISYYELEYLFKHYLEFNVIGRVLYCKYFLLWHEQATNLRRLTADMGCCQCRRRTAADEEFRPVTCLEMGRR